ncbi:homing endonuclease [Yersinia phage MHG19]|nr:homing endonuclease [Yersinia phage MHG19]
MQNVVYWLEFSQRIKNNTPPFFYIGSKYECNITNGVIIDKHGKEYWSSCKQQRFIDSLKNEKPIVKILHVCEDVLSEEEIYHIHYDVVKSELFFNKSMAKGNFKSCLKGVKKSESHKSKMRNSSALKGLLPWEHPHTISTNSHLAWLNSEIFYDWYFGPHAHSRLGPVIMSKETGLYCSTQTGNSIINKFKLGWNPYLDDEFQKFKSLHVI